MGALTERACCESMTTSLSIYHGPCMELLKTAKPPFPICLLTHCSATVMTPMWGQGPALAAPPYLLPSDGPCFFFQDLPTHRGALYSSQPGDSLIGCVCAHVCMCLCVCIYMCVHTCAHPKVLRMRRGRLCLQSIQILTRSWVGL